MRVLVRGHKGYIGMIMVPMLQAEGFTNLEKYFSFAEKVKETRRNLLDFLINLKRNRKSIVGYGSKRIQC